MMHNLRISLDLQGSVDSFSNPFHKFSGSNFRLVSSFETALDVDVSLHLQNRFFFCLSHFFNEADSVLHVFLKRRRSELYFEGFFCLCKGYFAYFSCIIII